MHVLAPQKVVVEFFGSGDPEMRDSHALRIDSLEDASDCPVLAAGVESLEDDQHLVLVLGVEQFLELL